VLLDDSELRGGDTGAQHPLGRHFVPGHRQTAQRPLQLGERQTGIQHGAEHHVAGNAGKTIQVE
jgi:hypothetical protein